MKITALLFLFFLISGPLISQDTKSHIVTKTFYNKWNVTYSDEQLFEYYRGSDTRNGTQNGITILYFAPTMIDDGIFSGDILIVDRSVKPLSGKLIVAVLDGELLVRRMQRNFNSTELVAANKKMSSIQLSSFDERSNVWGVVTCVIHVLEKNLFITKKSSEFNRTDKYGRQQKFY